MPDLRQGCATEKSVEDTAPADALVLFGAMGDLAHKKIFPALYHMVQHGHLDVPVIGVARAGRTNEHLKERVCDSIQQLPRALSRNSTQSLYKCRRVPRKIELHQGCARHCREALWTRPCLGPAVECRTSCGASGI